MVSPPGGLTDNIPMSLITSIPVDKPIPGKPLRQFSELLDVKQKTDVCRLCAAK